MCALMRRTEPKDLQQKILDGLERLTLVIRADARRLAAPLGINAAQDGILRLLRARPEGLRYKRLPSISMSGSRP
jgi:hypothetical protein